MKKDFDITKTKLVIWDLDETFWDGTLSEGSIKFNPEHLQLVEDLTLKGIMNSICSKNDHSLYYPNFSLRVTENTGSIFFFHP